jgi:hypothetical protein
LPRRKFDKTLDNQAYTWYDVRRTSRITEQDGAELMTHPIIDSQNLRLVSVVGSYAELMAHIGLFFPNGEIGEDNDGQVIIYTNLYPHPTTQGLVEDREPESFEDAPGNPDDERGL